jgi:hypothetical protein
MRRRDRHSGILRGLAPDQAGAALVEFSLVAPFLLALAFGVAEFGRFFYQYQMVVEGLRDAGRYLARVDPTLAENQENAKKLAVSGTIEDGADPRVDGWEAGDISVSFEETSNPSLASYRGPDPIRVVVVTTTFEYADVGLLSALGLGAISVTASHEQRVIDRAGNIEEEEEE